MMAAISERPIEWCLSNAPESWFALVVRPRHEKVAAQALKSKGLDTFLPLTTRRHQYANRSRSFDVPLFPGYLFCRFNFLQRLPVITTPGILRIVGAGASPIPVSDVEITSLQIATRERIPAYPHPFLCEGEKVTITEGPFFGMEGLVVSKAVSRKDALRIVVSIELLQRSVLLEIPAERIGALGSTSSLSSHDYL
jgi:transcription termination/antitermination protein NusG